MPLNNVKTYLKEGLINKSLKVMFLRAAGILFFFSLSLFLTNFFDANVVGQYDFARSWLLILGGLCMLGTNQAVIYYSGVLISKDSLGSLKRIYLKMLVIVFGAAAAFLLLYVLIPTSFIDDYFNKEGASELILKTMVSLAAFALTMLNIDTLRAQRLALVSELYRNLFRYLPFFLGAILIFYSDKAHLLVETYLAGFVVLALISTIQVFRVFQTANEPDHGIQYKYSSILKVSYPMALSAVSFFLMQSVDIILLGKFEEFEIVAYYGVAVKLATTGTLAILSVNVILAPKIAELFESQKFNELSLTLRRGTRLMVLISLPVLMALAIFSPFVLGLFGTDYTLATDALRILLLGQLINALCGTVGIYMNMTGKQRKLNVILVIGLIINIVLNYIFIPKYGMVGAASATAISMVIWKVIAVMYNYSKDKVITFVR